jgi:carbamoyl-phosphate synthase large subunit
MKSTGEVMGIDYTFDAALAKAIMAAGLALPPESGILFSIADRDKAEALPIIRQLAAAGNKLYATEGTASMIQTAGLPVKITSKKLNEGHPNIIDLINDGTISGVVNTTTGGHVPFRDGFYIRRAAVEKRIPCFTSLDTIRAAAATISRGVQSYTVQPLPDYRNRRPA